MGLLKKVRILNSINYKVLKPSQGDDFVFYTTDNLISINDGNDISYTRYYLENATSKFITNCIIIASLPLVAIFLSVTALALTIDMCSVVINSSDWIVPHIIFICVIGFIIITIITIYKCVWIFLIRTSIVLRLLSLIYKRQKGGPVFYKKSKISKKEIENLLMEWDVYD